MATTCVFFDKTSGKKNSNNARKQFSLILKSTEIQKYVWNLNDLLAPFLEELFLIPNEPV